MRNDTDKRFVEKTKKRDDDSVPVVVVVNEVNVSWEEDFGALFVRKERAYYSFEVERNSGQRKEMEKKQKVENRQQKQQNSCHSVVVFRRRLERLERLNQAKNKNRRKRAKQKSKRRMERNRNKVIDRRTMDSHLEETVEEHIDKTKLTKTL